MKNNIKTILALGLLASILGCHPESAWLTSPPVVEKSVNQQGGLPQLDITTHAEFLIVVDNSGSMQPKIDQVIKNITTFVNKFTENNPLTFNFGVLPIYDSTSFPTDEWIQRCGDGPPNARRVIRNGVLRAVRTQGDVLAPGNRYFISSEDPQLVQKMISTILIPIAQPYNIPQPRAAKGVPFEQRLAAARAAGKTANEVDGCGPNYEEVLSPIAAFYSFDPANPKYGDGRHYPENQGFYLDKNAFTFIIFLTDADDSSEFSAEQLASDLFKMKGGDESKVSAFGAIIPYGGAGGPGKEWCQPDAAAGHLDKSPGGPIKIQKFIAAVHGDQANLCSDTFGDDLAAWGTKLRKKTIERVIHLNGIPQWNPKDPAHTLRVFYGTKGDATDFEILPGDGGYHYLPDPTDPTIRLGDDLQLKTVPGGRLHIQYYPITPHDLHRGLAQPYSGK